MTNIVSKGASHAELFFLAGAPTLEDLRNGFALSGNSERTIMGYLGPHNIKLSSIFRSTILKSKMSYMGGKRSSRKEAASEFDLEALYADVKEEIRDVNPSVIIPMDDIALECLVPRTADMKTLPKGRSSWVECFRGSIMPLRADWGINARVIPTFSPQLLNTYFGFRAIVGVDYARIAKFRGKRTPHNEPGFCTIIRDPEKFRAWGNKYLRDKAVKFLTFDVETVGSLMTCISFCFDGYQAVVIPLAGYTDRFQAAQMWQLVAKILDHPIPKVNQNIAYDITITERHGCPVRNVVGDTMLAGHILYPEFPRGLDFYTSIFTEIPYYKDEGGRHGGPWTGDSDRKLIYCAKDSLATHQIYTEELGELEERNLLPIYNEVAPLILIYKSMQDRGLLRDESKRLFLLEKYERNYENLLAATRSLINDDEWNPNSPDQVGNLIYVQLGFKKRLKKSASGKSSFKTDKNTLDDILISGAGTPLGRNILKRIIILRKLVKVLQYLVTPTMHDNIYRYAYKICGTESGRTAGGKSIDQIFALKKGKWGLYNVGGSAQTVGKHGFELDEEFHETFEDSSISRDLRSMYVPRRGYCFVEGDGSGAEARYVGVLCADWEFMEHFDDKPKLHSRTAATIWDIDPIEIDRNQKLKTPLIVPGLGVAYYDMGKKGRHTANYNGSPQAFAIQTHLPLDECGKILERIHAANPKIRDVFHKEIGQVLRTTRVLRTPHGRERQFFGRYNADLVKEAISYLPQGTISDHTKFSMPRIRAEFPSAHFLVEAHDGLLAEIKLEEREAYGRVFKRIYERAIDCRPATLSRDYDLVIPAELSYSENSWFGMKDMEIE